MSAVLARIKTGYTNGGRGVGLRLVARLGALPVTPDQLTLAGLTLNTAAAALVVERHFVWATAAFVAGSILDILDGALAKAHGRGTPFGTFLDSTTDRLSEGLILGAIALVLADQGHQAALACVFVALVGSFLVSYTRAKAESIGLRGDVGLMARAERVVLIAAVLPFAGLGTLPYGIYLLAALTAVTVVQRIFYVRRQLTSEG